MPPIRSFPNIKPIKTERSHEENQERAYIAASRRSDRSLEARIESARRASEIHKRRTGRSLRVTESDVINEEMYEEEDDDLPRKYRQLTAHLAGNASDFNRRLVAHLTSQVAMRSALDDAMNGASTHTWDPNPKPLPPSVMSWIQQQQRQNAQIAQQQQQQQQQQTQAASPTVSSAVEGRSPSATFRQAPYPSPSLTNRTPSSNVQDESRRSSDPSSQQASRGNPPLAPSTAQKGQKSSTPASISTDQSSFAGPWSAPPQQLSFSPTGLTTSLPGDVQSFMPFGFNASEFNGRNSDQHEKPPHPTFDFGSFGSPGSGMNQTLAPGTFDSPEDFMQGFGNAGVSNGTFNFESDLENDFLNTPSERAAPLFGDAQPTPTDDFAAFIDSNAFEETPT